MEEQKQLFETTKKEDVVNTDTTEAEVVEAEVVEVEEVQSLTGNVEVDQLIHEFSKEQVEEHNLIDMLRKEIYPTSNEHEKKLLDEYDILNTGMAGINRAVEDIYKNELSKFIETEPTLLNTLYTSNLNEIKTQRVVETNIGDINKKKEDYAKYAADESFIKDENNFGVLNFLESEIKLANSEIENFTITVDSVKYYIKDRYLYLMDEKEGDNVYRLFTPNVKIIEEDLLEAYKIRDIKITESTIDEHAKAKESVEKIDNKINTYLYLLSFNSNIEVQEYTEFVSKYAYVTAIHMLFDEKETIDEFLEELHYYKTKYSKEGTVKIDYTSNGTLQRFTVKAAIKDIDKGSTHIAAQGINELIHDSVNLFTIALSSFINKNPDIHGLIVKVQNNKELLFDKELTFLIRKVVIKRYRKGFNEGLLKLTPSLYNTMYNTIDKNYFFTMFYLLSKDIANIIGDNITKD